MNVPAIILAAGASRRLGRPKQLVQVGGERLLDRAVRVVTESGIGPIVVVLGAHREAVLAEAMPQADFPLVRTVFNPNWERGIGSSIQLGARAALDQSSAVDGLMILVCDQPLLSVRHIVALLSAFAPSGQQVIAASIYAGTIGIPAVFPSSYFERLKNLDGDTGARSILRDPSSRIRPIVFEGGERDIDTAQDLAAFESPD